jgi:hypothetical protein
MIRGVGLICWLAVASAPYACADEIRHLSFPATLIGAWAKSGQLCAAKDPSNIAIGKADYHVEGNDCTVDWIVETAGALGPNYSVHASCASSAQPAARHADNLIMRSQGADGIVVGKSFDDLKPYQRCTAAQ